MNKTAIVIGFLILVSSCVAILLISGVITVENQDTDEETMAETWLLEMVDGSFDNIENNMSDDVKKALPPGTLSNTIQKMFELEKFKGIESTASITNNDYTSVQIISNLSTKKLVFDVGLNAENKIETIWFSYSPLPPPSPIENDVLKEESINIGKFNLNGIITVPKNSEKHPIAILIQGSGNHGLESTVGIGENKPFRDIAHGLAENGIASIRFDERYYAYPGLILKDYTIFNENINDVNSAIELASKQFDDIYLIGLSQGGMIAPYIAENNPNVKGFVSLAGSPRGLEDIILDQNIDAYEALGYTEKQIEQELIPLKIEINKIKSLKEGKEGEVLLKLGTLYWHSLNQTTGEDNATNFSCPALILQGGKDFQVNTINDFEYWKSLMKNKENVSYKLYDDLNHLFMPSNGDMNILEYNKPNNVSNEVIKDISDWILKIKDI